MRVSVKRLFFDWVSRVRMRPASLSSLAKVTREGKPRAQSSPGCLAVALGCVFQVYSS